MTIHFGIDFDGPVYTPTQTVSPGILWAGPIRLLNWLETCLGYGGYKHNTDYLRIELYRQAINRFAAESPTPPFFFQSFEADRFATAATLLNWRDELLLAGWSFETRAHIPPRLEALSKIEVFFQTKLKDPSFGPQAAGLADRFAQIQQTLPKRHLTLHQIYTHEPIALYPIHIQRLFSQLSAKGTPIIPLQPTCAANPDTHLGRFQHLCLKATQSFYEAPPAPQSPQASPTPTSQTNYPIPLEAPLKPPSPPGEGLGVGLLRAPRDSHAATFLAQLLPLNPSLRPLVLLPDMNLLLEQNLLQEGQPAMGVLSASLARPSLQVLKLAPAFLWEPVDVFKIMEFVTLPVKPLDNGLALEIARVLAEKPGLFSDKWFAVVYGYLEQEEAGNKARQQYEFWFERRRYRADASAPKREVIDIYAYLETWARSQQDENNTKTAGLPVLAEQARRIRELLEALPEPRLSFLELERIVRTIYEPSPMQLGPAEIGRLEYVHKAGAIAAPAHTILWWNCAYENGTPAPDKWHRQERQYLANIEVFPDLPEKQGRLNLLRQYRPVLQASHQLLLVVPDQATGVEMVPNLLLGDLEAALGGALFHDCTFRLDREADLQRLKKWFQLPEQADLAPRLSGRPQPQLRIRRPEWLAESEYETPTNLEALFYYPHQWFFKKLRLFPTSLLSISSDQLLLGSLAHRLFELLLQEEYAQMDKKAVYKWIDEKAGGLLVKEGATLLLYGREPERNMFLHRVKHAAWSLLSLLRENNWTVLHTEWGLEGSFSQLPIKGKADIVLQRGEELAIIDLKWGGATRRKDMIRNGEDLQLMLYAHLLPPPEQWPHTAYFILEDGKMIARNNAAFKEAQTAAKDAGDHADISAYIFKRMERTFEWRMAQIRRGLLELRTRRTAAELEALYEGELMDVLEMKTEDAKYDHYKMLLL